MKILKEHLLLDQETVNVYKNLVIVDINHDSEVVNVDIGTQSKVKESKVNKSKVKEKEIETGEQKPLSFPTRFHEIIFEQFHEITYRTFFEDCKIEEKERLIVITTKDTFRKTTIQNRAKELKIFFGKDVSVELEEGD